MQLLSQKLGSNSGADALTVVRIQSIVEVKAKAMLVGLVFDDRNAGYPYTPPIILQGLVASDILSLTFYIYIICVCRLTATVKI